MEGNLFLNFLGSIIVPRQDLHGRKPSFNVDLRRESLLKNFQNYINALSQKALP